jgi:hypothetical protein
MSVLRTPSDSLLYRTDEYVNQSRINDFELAVNAAALIMYDCTSLLQTAYTVPTQILKTVDT